MLTAEEVEPTNGEVKDFPTLEEINKMREKRISENLESCQKELTALLEKYNVRLAVKVVAFDGQLQESSVMLIPK